MFIPYEYSIVGSLNQKLKKNGIKLNIINASQGGKSTLGYINNFNHWFSKIKNFNPKIFIFYIGINDSYLKDPNYDINEMVMMKQKRFSKKQKLSCLIYWCLQLKMSINILMKFQN